MKLFRAKISSVAHCAFLASISLSAVAAQSTDQQFPTPVTTNEIRGSIKARDIGDARLTSYFYVFEGGQGDIFINVVTKNFSGDIDVFTAEGLKPLTKMVIYADSGFSETGRLVYLRKAERLMLRVEGRSPNDDASTFQIKFAGSFVALAGQKTEEAPAIAQTGEDSESRTKVNSVGTIIEVAPRPQVTKKPIAAASDATKENDPAKEAEKETKPATVYENDSAKVTVKPTAKPVTKRPPRPKRPARAAKSEAKTQNPPVKVEEKKPDPLASIRLVIQLKDGNVIERPMSEVLKFSVDKGMLTVIIKDGTISRYSILVVAKVTIE